MRPNVRTTDTGITHGHGYDYNKYRRTRCGLRYLRNGDYRWGNDFSPITTDTTGEVDCMACVAMPEHPHEVVVADSVEGMAKEENERLAMVIRTKLGLK